MNTPERFDDETLDWLAKPRDPIRDAQNALINGGGMLFSSLPVIIQNIIINDLWKAKTSKSGEPFSSFREFVEDKGFWGLNTRYDDLVYFCRKDAECVAMLEAERGEAPTHADAGSKGGRGNKASDNVTSFKHDRGNSADYTKRRLKRDRPDLYERVIAGEMSPNAAAIEAGFRKKKREISFQDHAERLAADYDTAYLIGLIRCLTLRLRAIEECRSMVLADTAASRTVQ